MKTGTLNSKNKRLFSIRHCTIYSKIEFCIILLHVSGGIFELIRRQHKARKLHLAFTDQTDFFNWQGGFIFVKWFNNSSVSYFLNSMRNNISDTVRIITDKKMDDHIDQWMPNLSGTKTVGHVCYIQALYFREPVHTL
jgi:hypothetical protein